MKTRLIWNKEDLHAYVLRLNDVKKTVVIPAGKYNLDDQ